TFIALFDKATKEDPDEKLWPKLRDELRIGKEVADFIQLTINNHPLPYYREGDDKEKIKAEDRKKIKESVEQWVRNNQEILDSERFHFQCGFLNKATSGHAIGWTCSARGF